MGVKEWISKRKENIQKKLMRNMLRRKRIELKKKDKTKEELITALVQLQEVTEITNEKGEAAVYEDFDKMSKEELLKLLEEIIKTAEDMIR